jgi:hypothetical protein
MRAQIMVATAFPCRWEGEKRNKEYRRIPNVSFQEVEGHQHNFVSLRVTGKLDLDLTNELCQT